MDNPITLFLLGMAIAAVIVLGVESRYGRMIVETCCRLGAHVEAGPQHQAGPEDVDSDVAEDEDEVYEDRHVAV